MRSAHQDRPRPVQDGEPATEAPQLYALALEHGGLRAWDPEAAAALGLTSAGWSAGVAELVGMNLLRESAIGDDDVLEPVCPDVAAAGLIAPISEQIHRHREAIGAIERRLGAFRSRYEARLAATTDDGEVVSLRTGNDLSERLHAAVEVCREDFLGGVGHGGPELSWLAGLGARGVRVRLLVPHALRADLRSRVLLNRIVATGGEVATVGSLPRWLLLFDQDAGFLLDCGQAPGSPGVLVRHPQTVRLLRGLLEPTWAGAQPYGAGRVGYQAVADDLQRSILDLMARGLTDEVIARRLGISVRTCRRHVASLLGELRAVSRFQAGALAAAAGLVQPRPVSRVAAPGAADAVLPAATPGDAEVADPVMADSAVS
jgi:DNA-binding CsgD family transcriptional regulator